MPLTKTTAHYDAVNPYYLHLHNQKLPITQKKGEPHEIHKWHWKLLLLSKSLINQPYLVHDGGIIEAVPVFFKKCNKCVSICSSISLLHRYWCLLESPVTSSAWGQFHCSIFSGHVSWGFLFVAFLAGLLLLTNPSVPAAHSQPGATDSCHLPVTLENNNCGRTI